MPDRSNDPNTIPASIPNVHLLFEEFGLHIGKIDPILNTPIGNFHITTFEEGPVHAFDGDVVFVDDRIPVDPAARAGFVRSIVGEERWAAIQIYSLQRKKAAEMKSAAAAKLEQAKTEAIKNPEAEIGSGKRVAEQMQPPPRKRRQPRNKAGSKSEPG